MEAKERSYFRLKTECIVESPDHSLTRKKIEELVYATNYTEVETLAHEIIHSLNRTQFGEVTYEIIKTKIPDVLFNDILSTAEEIKGFACDCFEEEETSGVGLYAVKVIFITIDEKTAKEKQTTEMFYTPAESNADATRRINEHLKNTMGEFVIRDAKFDKAEAIYWPLDVHKSKVHDFELS